jgi:hypothetical protein
MPPNLRFALLKVRDIGFASTSNITCAAPIPNLVGEPLTGNFTFHHLMILIAAPCLGLTVLSTVWLSWRHLHRYTAPQEQRQILRIVNLPAAYAIFNFLALCFYPDYQYIEPISGVYESISVVGLFFLLLEYACPDGQDRETFFDQLQARDKKGNPIPGGSLTWFKNTYGQALQYPILKLTFTVITIVTQYFHKYCENSFSPKYAHLWLTLVDFLILGGAFTAVTKFAQKLGKEKRFQRAQKIRAKVFSYLGILIFQMLQGVSARCP